MSPCIEAAGCKNNSGYVYVSRGGKWVGAHRLAWSEAHGPIPKGGRICHTRDNRVCVNPEHLFLGTARDNTLDMIAKGRRYCTTSADAVRGEQHGIARLTEAQVRLGRELRAAGYTYREISEQLDVWPGTVFNFCKRKTWAHVP